MKKKGVKAKRIVLTIIAVILVTAGLTMLIAPRISNQIGKEIAHSTVEEFRRLKNSISEEEPTTGGGGEGSMDINVSNASASDTSQNCDGHIVHSDDKQACLTRDRSLHTATKADIDRLYTDSVAYNENLKLHQAELLVNEQSYKKPALDLSSYGITNGVYGSVSAPSIGMELPIYLGATDDNMDCGAAHMTYTSLPIGGESTNCVLSGHSGYIGRIFFDYIVDMAIGDEITVENYWNVLTYKVVDRQIHSKDESADCYITEGRDLLTLITCISNGRGGFDRFYLIAERTGGA